MPKTNKIKNKSRTKKVQVQKNHLPVTVAVNLAVVFEELADKLEVIGRSIKATEVELRTKTSMDADMHRRPSFFGLLNKIPSSRRSFDSKHKPHTILTQHYRTTITRRITQPLPDTADDDTEDETFSSRLHDKMTDAIHNCYVSTFTTEGKIQRDRLALERTVQSTMKEMMESSTFHTIVEAVALEKSLKKEMIATIQRNFKNEDRKRVLKEDISNVSVTRRKEILAHERMIWTLEDLTQELESKMAASQAYVEAQGSMLKKKSKLMCRVRDSKMVKKASDASLKTRLEERAHISMVDFLDQLINERVNQLEYWSDKYHTDIYDFKSEIEFLHLNRAKGLERMDWLRWNINDLNQVVKDFRREKAIKEGSVKRHAVETKMATKIQALWRGYTVRENIGYV